MALNRNLKCFNLTLGGNCKSRSGLLFKWSLEGEVTEGVDRVRLARLFHLFTMGYYSRGATQGDEVSII